MNDEGGLADLKDLLEREIAAPGSVDEAVDSLREAFPELRFAVRFLKLKDDHHRHAFYLKSESVWFQRFGWRLMRPLFILALIAAVLFSVQRQIDPTLGIAVFLAGAASFYVVLQVFIHRWAFRDRAKLDEINARYRERLRELLEEMDSSPDADS